MIEPRNPKSRCATCEHLGLNSFYPCLHCYMRDVNIYKGYSKCKDYLPKPKKIKLYQQP